MEWSFVTEIKYSKCKIVSFGRRIYKNYEYNINENNHITSLEYEESYKDLGVILDDLFEIIYMKKFIKLMQCLE